MSIIKEYVANLPVGRQKVIVKICDVIRANLPEGFEETMGYGMIAYVVPHTIYPKGYHVEPNLPLPFLNVASQKNHIGLYHMGLYSDPELLEWFRNEYAERSKYKLDMGKSCIRFKKIESIPFDLIGELVTKVSVSDWIALYESSIRG